MQRQGARQMRPEDEEYLHKLKQEMDDLGKEEKELEQQIAWARQVCVFSGLGRILGPR